MGTAPEVFRGVNGSGARARFIQRANVTDADLSAQQIVEVNVHVGGRIHGDVNILVADDVLRDDGADDGRTAISAVDVDADATRGCGV